MFSGRVHISGSPWAFQLLDHVLAHREEHRGAGDVEEVGGGPLQLDLERERIRGAYADQAVVELEALHRDVAAALLGGAAGGASSGGA
jgi:hypothetical protein